jgi:hypothetical protein
VREGLFREVVLVAGPIQPELVSSRSGESGTWERSPGWTGPCNSWVSRPLFTSLRVPRLGYRLGRRTLTHMPEPS